MQLRSPTIAANRAITAGDRGGAAGACLAPSCTTPPARSPGSADFGSAPAITRPEPGDRPLPSFAELQADGEPGGHTDHRAHRTAHRSEEPTDARRERDA